jgi:hypothetical protein
MRTYDFSPLFRSTIGFDRLFDLAETAQRAAEESYPPYNIERLAEDRYQITLAVAGFSRDEISITAEQNVVTIEGGKTEKTELSDSPSAFYDLPLQISSTWRSGLLKDGQMKRARFTEEQIIGVLREHEAGAKTARGARADGADQSARQAGHDRLRYLTPAAYAAYLTATCDRLRNSDQLRQSQGAHTAAKRRNFRRESNLLGET